MHDADRDVLEGHLVVQLGRAIRRFEQGLILAQVFHRLVEHLVRDFGRLVLDPHLTIAAEFGGRALGHHEYQLAPLFLHVFELAHRVRFDLGGVERLAVDGFAEVIQRLAQHGFAAIQIDDDVVRRFARTEAGNTPFLGDLLGGFPHGLLQAFGVNFDGQAGGMVFEVFGLNV